MKTIISKFDEWLRRRIRMITWKRWKKISTKFTNLRKLGVARDKSWEWSNARFEEQGYLNFLKYYLEVRV